MPTTSHDPTRAFLSCLYNEEPEPPNQCTAKKNKVPNNQPSSDQAGVHQGSKPETGAHEHAEEGEKQGWLPADPRPKRATLEDGDSAG